MLTLKAEKRNPDEKAKKLRRDGFITGVLYGKEMKERRYAGLSGTGWQKCRCSGEKY